MFIFFSVVSFFLFSALPLLATERYCVSDFGAVGDGITIDTDAINNAIIACERQGGGIISFPKGTYLIGTIHLKSNICLEIPSGVTLKGCLSVREYDSYIPQREMNKYLNANAKDWNRALLLGVGVENVSIIGDGIIDGGHLYDPCGEEGMRGPHTLLFAESRNICLKDIQIRQAANYALMGYEISHAKFENVTIQEGWDGIHIRGGDSVSISKCLFFTGDDAIAGGYWRDFTIDECMINSSCNGIRLIMPATKLKITNCSFVGPGLYPHRTSKELMRKNMLSAILLQPGGWGKTPGDIDQIEISNIRVDQVDNALMMVLNEENKAGHISIRDFYGTRIKRAPISIESWKGEEYERITMKNLTLYYQGANDSTLIDIPIEKPHVDARILPCWALFAQNIHALSLENVEFYYQGKEYRPGIIMKNVTQLNKKNVIVEESQTLPSISY
ncbi:MAG: glycosyl hydrolase family 28-related protein [Bacteroidales bacterium]|nr:glycosyl hydrolase family 28-related protein [Bacteroidales bacterium]